MDYQISTVRPYIHPLMREITDKSRTEQLAAKLTQAMTVLEAALESRAYLAGESFSVGDIPLGIVTYRWRLLDIEQPELPRLSSWLERLKQRPAFQKTICPPEETTTALRSDAS